jgi:hypothetical protein
VLPFHRRDAEAQSSGSVPVRVRRLAATAMKVVLLAVFAAGVSITTLLMAVASGIYGGAAARMHVFTPIKLLNIWKPPFSPENLLR